MSAPASDPCAIVIFGSTGDLAQRKLIPALYALAREGRLDPRSPIIGFSRSESGDGAMAARLCAAVTEAEGGTLPDPAAWELFARRLHAFQAGYDDPESYRKLKGLLDGLDATQSTGGSRLWYLAVPPSAYAQIVRHLGAAGLVPRGTGHLARGWNRVIIEKPFGHDLPTALALNEEISTVLSEDQTYRIDHYLGKETVQNIIVLRFGNGIFEPLWNRRYIDSVQITVGETIGIGSRGRFYEEAGALRDIVQNHLLQLLALIAMEPPVANDADAIRDEKVKVLRAIRPIPRGEVDRVAVRGQYGEGTVRQEAARAYRKEPNVAPASATETFVAMKLLIENWRWAGVPFYLRTGKRMARTATEVAIRYTKIPHLLFQNIPPEQMRPNTLVLRIQPDEGISLSIGAKAPGAEMEIKPVDLDFSYEKSFGDHPTPAYERLILDAIRGDASLFIRDDGVKSTWSVVQPIIEHWQSAPPPVFPNYASGSWGPAAADELLGRDHRRWRNV